MALGSMWAYDGNVSGFSCMKYATIEAFPLKKSLFQWRLKTPTLELIGHATELN